MSRGIRHSSLLRLGALAALVLLSLSGCAKKRSGIIKDCILPEDQSGTLSGRWKVPPIAVSLKSGDFSAEESQAIGAAAEVWNSFYGESLGIKVIDVGDPNSPSLSSSDKPSVVCPAGNQSLSPLSNVVIYKEATWSHPDKKNAIALTTYCPVANQPLPIFNMAIMELNAQYFFSAGNKQPDLQSIFVHEFGHLVGLDHSCEAGSKTGFPTCDGGKQDYLEAIMFPVVLFDGSGIGEIRRELNDNDQGRANCLYSAGS